MQNSKYNILFLIAYLITILLSLKLSTQWLIMATFWFGLVFYIQNFKSKNRTRLELRFFQVISILYPIIETGIKYFIHGNIIPYSWYGLNTFEHFAWAFFFTFMAYFFWKEHFAYSKKSMVLLHLIAIVTLFGNLNEFLEYLLREYYNLSYIIYYSDTIRDMFMNLLGGGLAGILIISKFETRINKPI